MFGALGARWHLFGAQAAIVHDAARLTADVDVTVDLAALDLDVLVRQELELAADDLGVRLVA